MIESKKINTIVAMVVIFAFIISAAFLRYFAAHSVVVNLDSYSSGMAQNYYIYERDGKLTILPWDYNLAWGGFQSGNASSVINFPIDTPVSGIDMSSRPLIDKLFSDPEYLERYHGYLQQIINNYFAEGKFQEKINALDALISDYVKNDPTAFCTYDEYKSAVSAFITLGDLRAQSIQGQLDGTIPSTTVGQNADPTSLVSTESLDLSQLGSNMGGRGGNGSAFPAGGFRWFKGEDSNAPGGTREQDNGENSMSIPRGTGDRNDSDDPQRREPGAFQGDFGQTRQQRHNNSDQSNNAKNGFNLIFASSQGSISSGVYITGGSILVLITAIIFAKRSRRSY